MTSTPPNITSLKDLSTEHLLQDFYFTQHGVFSRADLFAHARAFSERLPEQSYAINLCHNRYLFIVSYLAVILRQQTTLLPPNQSPQTLSELTNSYPGTYCITDDRNTLLHPPNISICFEQIIHHVQHRVLPDIDLDRTLSISFTSGSTGKPKAITKTWREFEMSAHLALKQLNLAAAPIILVSTVPPQHMYGLETSLFWALYSSFCVHDSRPFFPQDIHHNLQAHITPKLLISTPTHLKACINSHIHWPPVSMILSSTAPMPSNLAIKIEQEFKAPLHELLGSTETLSFASRQPVKSQHWQPYFGIELQKQNDGFVLSGGHLQQSVILDDTYLIAEDGTFILQGRSTDLVKIAGKRASLAELNRLLNSIPGIDDGIFFFDKHERLSIVIVSELANNVIRQALKPAVDPVFLPRRVIRTAALPRNATGKLLKAELDTLIRGFELA